MAFQPIPVEVTAGETYWWCRCGRGATQPFCDGTHKGSEYSPLKYVAGESKKLWFCVCKKTGTPPLCDGAHRTLP
jgi:CDGSH iron-sulfur domain-containing protein 3